MGDAADDLWDSNFKRESDFWALVLSIRDNCERGGCQIVPSSDDDIESDDWLPYRCRTCGERFDFP